MISLACLRTDGGKGCDLEPSSSEAATLASQSLERCWSCNPILASGDKGLDGGGRLPCDGLPPPSRRGRSLKPSCTTTESSCKAIAADKGRDEGRSVRPDGSCEFMDGI